MSELSPPAPGAGPVGWLVLGLELDGTVPMVDAVVVRGPPDAVPPDALPPDAAPPEAAPPDAALPDVALPDAALPDALLPEVLLLDAALPDAALPPPPEQAPSRATTAAERKMRRARRGVVPR